LIFKEENILFPTSLEKLTINDWIEILGESGDIGYVFIEKPIETKSLIKELKGVVIEEPTVDGTKLSFPTGEMELNELMNLLNTLPVEITFVDKNDIVKYFSDSKDKAFVRTKAIIGRKVQNCHPPQTVENVEKIIKAFKEGKRDSVDFWIKKKGRFEYIRYLAVRDNDGKYLGILEVSQDISDIKMLEGEKRLLDF
jgi:PAS domain S-box-containing protein